MNVLLESPMPVIFAGILLETVLGAFWVTTRRGVLWIVMAAVLGLVALGVWIEHVVLTEREQVEATLDGLADALKANDLPRVLAYLAPSAEQTRRRAIWALGLVEVTDAKIRNLRVTVNHLTSPPTAEAAFDGIVFFRGKHTDLVGRDRYPARFVVQLEWDGQRWLVTDHIEYQQISL